MVLLLSAATNQVLGLLGSCTSSSCDALKVMHHAIGLMKRNEKKNRIMLNVRVQSFHQVVTHTNKIFFSINYVTRHPTNN